jgi:hypothetical protein
MPPFFQRLRNLLRLGQTFLDRLPGGLTAGASCAHLCLHVSERNEHLLGLTVLEFMQDVFQPRLKYRSAFAQDGLPGRRHTLCVGGKSAIQLQSNPNLFVTQEKHC